MLTPIAANDRAKPAPKGRTADRLAAIIAFVATALAVLAAGIFFAGFVENDKAFGAVIAAFLFTALIGAFAIIPPLIIGFLARRSYKRGAVRRDLLWALVLALPWTILSVLIMLYTPLPIWISLAAFIVSLLLTLWAVISLFLKP